MNTTKMKAPLGHVKDPVELDYHRLTHPEKFVKLPENIAQVSIKEDADGVYIVDFVSDKPNRIWVEIKDLSVRTELRDGLYLQTDVLEHHTLKHNLWLFFIRYINYSNNMWLDPAEQCIFKRDKEPWFFKYFDESIHTLSIRSDQKNSTLIRIKYLKSHEAGSIELRVDGGRLVHTDPRYPYAFTFTGAHPQLDDVVRVTANMITCMRALEESDPSELNQTEST